jgi:uncharacterized protein (DUF2252 family)
MARKKIALLPAADRIAYGKQLRDKVTRDSHAAWSPDRKTRTDPLEILEATDKGRIKELLPIRYGRMQASPFAFFRGAAAVMAADLARTPRTGIGVQACGDCHLANFGGYEAPDRRLIFAINDFDETLPGPWEWDLKRLCASLVVAARHNDLRASQARAAAVACARGYRKRMSDLASKQGLEIWYMGIDVREAIGWFASTAARDFKRRLEKAAADGISEDDYPRLAVLKDGAPRIRDDKDVVYHPRGTARTAFERNAREAFDAYRKTLTDDRRRLLDRYTPADIAQKTAGVGSTGTWCGIVLLTAGKEDPLFLQIKEARASVLEAHLQRSEYRSRGQRVVMGQRVMQADNDPFLGWTTGPSGRHYYVRQLRDPKVKPLVEDIDAGTLELYGAFCGWALALAHARSGDAALIAGYLGNGSAFDKAMGTFAEQYAGQNERDHAALCKAIADGRIEARDEE